MLFRCLAFLLGGLATLGHPASLLHPSWSWGQRIIPSKPFIPLPTLASRGGPVGPPPATADKPFLPFFDLGAPAGPLRPDDGTTKSRVPEDTLTPSSRDAYTTLDKLQKGLSKKGRKGPFKKIRGGLGGLDPKEVFYADEDLLIIKGGGFGAATYEEPPQQIETPREPPFFPVGKPVRVPSPADEYNGNIPTILPPPPRAASRFSPFSLFLPSSLFPQGQSSSPYPTYTPFPGAVGPRWFLYLVPVRGWKQASAALQHLYSPNQISSPRPKPHNGHPGVVETFSSPEPLQKHPANVLISLEGDTDVNFLHPRPQINPDAEMVTLHSESRRPNEPWYEFLPTQGHNKPSKKAKGNPRL